MIGIYSKGKLDISGLGSRTVARSDGLISLSWLVALLMAVLMAMALSACAPKRVVRGHTDSSPTDSPETVSKSPTPAQGDSDLSLPSPQAHGRMGSEHRGTPTANLLLGLKAATMAQQQLDKPYQWGAQGPEKFDCSGLVFYIYGALDVSLPRVSRDQAKYGQEVAKSDLQPGDLVFFITSGKVINHVGIYIGKSRFIHAPRRYSPVRYDSLNDAWWRRRFQFGRRIQG